MWRLNTSNALSSRRQIAIKEVRDGILILPNNEYRLILETSSVNFELKSDEEQDVLIDGFENFLNALPCKLQILVRVREIDIDRYIEDIGATRNREKEPVYKNQITNYCTFIKNLVSGNKILSRKFYNVIPYTNSEKTKDMKLIKEHLYLNREIVMRGLEKLGMKAWELDSLEVLNLFYSFYNPGSSKTQELTGQTVHALLQHSYV
jgi:hypothetical protein